ncbi:MAG: FAD-dependent oxidoreductase [Nitrososphaerota archaeon]
MSNYSAKRRLVPEKWDYEVDVVVVGYGGSGAAAALTAQEFGAEVLILEKSPVGGGNAAISMGQCSSPDNVEGAVRYLHAACGDTTPIEVIRAWAEEASKNRDWWDKMDIEYTDIGAHCEFPNLPGAESMRVIWAKGWGKALFLRLDQHIRERGIKILFNSPARELIQDPETREILGVIAERFGRSIYVKARRAVILCTGGFEFNEEMKKQFLRCYPVKFFGWKYNTGDGIRMAQMVGADLWHMNNICGGYCTCNPSDPTDVREVDLKANSYIWVDRYGKRFTAEKKDPQILHSGWILFAEFDLKMSGYSRIPSYIIFDEKVRQAGPVGPIRPEDGGKFPMGRLILPPELGGIPSWSMDNAKEIKMGWIKCANTIEELALKIGDPLMKPEVLKATVERWNYLCKKGLDQDFERNPETLSPIDEPPFYAILIYPGLVCTLGGPRRNEKAQILDPRGKPIPRLYAAGNLGSIYGQVYSVRGGNLGEAFAFGRIAGRNAAKEQPWE